MTEPGATHLARWRGDTPGTTHRIHLNNAGAGLMPAPVLAAVTDHLRVEADIGGYEAADQAAAEIEQTYQQIGALIGAQRRNVAIVENATVAVAQALSAFDWRPGDVVVTSNADYVSNQLMLLSLQARCGIEVRRAGDLPAGGVDPEQIASLLAEPRVKLVVLSWIPTNSGLIQDVAAVGRACRDRGVAYLVDACQAVGQLPVDVAEIHADFLAATARKFLRGPRGIGFLFASDRALDAGWYPLFIDLRGGTWLDPDKFAPAADARRFENWEFSVASVLGLGAAARYALAAHADGALLRTQWLAEQLVARLGAVPGVRRLDRGRHRSAIVTLDLGRDPTPVMHALRGADINTSCFGRSAAVIDMDAKGIAAGLRVSPHYYNSLDELDRFVASLASLLR
ncbi:MAG: aminotransferase class V-fold PLP-dependent enzyme [Gemmatimonadales bacterium]